MVLNVRKSILPKHVFFLSRTEVEKILHLHSELVKHALVYLTNKSDISVAFAIVIRLLLKEY